MNALITGATGFLGGHLAKGLMARGDTVVGLVHDGHAGMLRDLSHWVFGDILDINAIERAIAEYEIDTVFHLAAQTQTSTATASPLGTFRANIEGTWNVLEACRRQSVERVICASTDKAYGEHAQRCSENFALDGRGPYEASKVCADTLAQCYAQSYGMSIAITRCANLYGPGHMNWSTIIPGTVKRILSGKRPRIYNGGESTREFLYVGDAVEGYIRLADIPYVGPINLGSGLVFQAKDVVSKIQTLLGTTLAVEDIGGRSKDIKHQRLDSSLAKKILEWEARTPFDEGLAKTVAWYKGVLDGNVRNAYAPV